MENRNYNRIAIKEIKKYFLEINILETKIYIYI